MSFCLKFVEENPPKCASITQLTKQASPFSLAVRHAFEIFPFVPPNSPQFFFSFNPTKTHLYLSSIKRKEAMEQQQRNQKTMQQDQNEELDDVQHGPFPVEQLQVSNPFTPISDSPFSFLYLGIICCFALRSTSFLY